MTAARTRVIGIGQPNAGDDYVGIAVARALRAQKLPAGVDIHEISDPARLIDLLDGIQCAILVDALVNDSDPGEILCLTPEDLATYPSMPLSSHGTSVADAIGLLRILSPAPSGCEIHIIGISIKPPGQFSLTQSAPIAAAIPRAVSLVVKLLEGGAT